MMWAYFVQSEQVPTALRSGGAWWTGTTASRSPGIPYPAFAQADEIIDKLEVGIQRAGAVTPMLESGMTPEDILGAGLR